MNTQKEVLDFLKEYPKGKQGWEIVDALPQPSRKQVYGALSNLKRRDLVLHSIDDGMWRCKKIEG